MDIRESYLINEETILFTGVYSTRGELHTLVVQGEDEIFLVAMSPLKLIDHTLISFGSNLQGALKSSKELLGTKLKMYPIKISDTLNIWIFPTKSSKKKNCMWFILKHVKDSQPHGAGKTKVSLSYGHTIVIEMKASSFRNKRNHTEDLREKIRNNTKNSVNFIVLPEQGIRIVEHSKKKKYIFLKNKGS